MNDLESVILSEVSQTRKEKYCMILLMCRIKKKNIKMNLFTKLKETDLENELMVCQVGRMERKDS